MDSLLEYYKSSPIGGWLAFIDVALLLWNVLHALFVTSLIVSKDSPFKKPMIKFHYNTVRYVHSFPLLPDVMTVGLMATTGYLWVLYRRAEEANGDLAILVRCVIAAYTTVSVLVLRKLSYALIRMGPDKVLDLEQELAKHDMINFKPPSKAVGNSIVAPLEALLRTDVTGIDNLSQTEPALYVMNHSLHGIEMGLFVNTVYQQKDIYLRGLADHVHFALPHGEILRAFGAVDGTRENVMTLMENKQNILVYPGGGHEVMKPSTVPKYTLMWKERLGFARLAIRYGYPIQPCAAVGTEDMLDIMLDIPVTFLRKGQYVPVLYPVSPHKLQKVYFWFGEPIPTKHYNGDWKNDTYAREVRDKAKSAIENAIKELQDKQSKDPDRFLMKKFANQIRSAEKAALSVFEDGLRNAGKNDDEDDDAPEEEKEGADKAKELIINNEGAAAAASSNGSTGDEDKAKDDNDNDNKDEILPLAEEKDKDQ